MKDILDNLMELHGTEVNILDQLAAHMFGRHSLTWAEQQALFDQLDECHKGLEKTQALVRAVPE